MRNWRNRRASDAFYLCEFYLPADGSVAGELGVSRASISSAAGPSPNRHFLPGLLAWSLSWPPASALVLSHTPLLVLPSLVSPLESFLLILTYNPNSTLHMTQPLHLPSLQLSHCPTGLFSRPKILQFHSSLQIFVFSALRPGMLPLTPTPDLFRKPITLQTPA